MNKYKTKKLVTHDGSFHADDVFAYAILNALFPTNSLIRSRDKEKMLDADIVFDVGGGEYDHHTTNKVYRDNGIPYAAFGLIWRDFGKEFLSLVEDIKNEDIEFVHQKLDEDFVQAIDAFDNGVNLSTNTVVKVHTVSTLISGFNYRVPTGEAVNKKLENHFFKEASMIAFRLFMNEILGIVDMLKLRKEIKKSFNNRKHPQLLELNEAGNWQDTVEELDVNEEILYVIYPRPDGYYIQVMRKEKGKFDARKDLPKEWADKRDDELSQIVGIDDAIFCHPALFLAGAKSKESIMKMAHIALEKEV